MGFITGQIIRNTYRDSVFLMKISGQATQLEGVELASAMMATERNKELLKSAGLSFEGLDAANPNDMAIAMRGENEQLLHKALNKVTELLSQSLECKEKPEQESVASLEQALAEDGAFNLALISVAGDYAKYEAAKAISKGLHVMLYSDNISLEDELRLKQAARRQGVMVMGPDCGTAIINGVPLAFANRVRPGRIGIVGASGTGIQEVTCLVHALGQGISQAIGTGGRDLKDEIGGISMETGINYLLADPGTQVIVIVSKPPGRLVREKLCRIYREAAKPILVNYAGCEDYTLEKAAGAITCSTLEEAATRAVNLVSHEQEKVTFADGAAYSLLLKKARQQAERGKFLRGVFGGGSLCYEAINIVKAALAGGEGTPGNTIYSNIALAGIQPLAGREKSRAHTLLDMGEDEFTVGKPHPMIDPTEKHARLEQEMTDPQTAVVLFDVVLGYGTHPDPAGEIVKTLGRAKKKGGSGVCLIASVCGTDEDITPRSEQVKKLLEAGVIVMPSNAHTAKLAGDVIRKIQQEG